MKSVGEQLKAAREAKGLSLNDISQITRINRKYLEEIEQNITPQLPPTYVNAFLKAFAREVDLDLNTLSESQLPLHPIPKILLDAGKAVHEDSDRISDGSVPIPKNNTAEEGTTRQNKSMFVILILLVTGLAASIVLLHKEKTAPPREISFSDVVKEQESKNNVMNAATDSLAIFDQKRMTIADSLFLEGVASESVWVHIVIDGMKTSELIFPPAFHMKWKAKKNFVVSIGNAQGISFMLNGIRLGLLGTTKKPLRNYIISQETLQKLRAILKEHDAKH